MSNIVKSTQSCSHGHLPYLCSFYCSARALDALRGVNLRCAVAMGANVLNKITPHFVQENIAFTES